jgi:hypothetical protein
MGFGFLTASLAAIFGRKPVNTKTAKHGTATASPYRAVSIVLGDAPCSAVHRFKRRRYLSSAAPPLPLPTCDSSACTCSFRRHKDRRAGPRRRTDIGVMSAPWGGQEKRRPGRGRRAEDRAEDM